MTFNRNPNVSRYFMICTVTTSNLDAGFALHSLRHDLLEKGAPLGSFFHASTDKQAVRDAVFQTILSYPWKVQATICEKAKAKPSVTTTKARFYKIPWYFHLKHGISNHVPVGDHLIVTAASIGTNNEKTAYIDALEDVTRQNVVRATWSVDFRPAMADPWLQIADYCAWAIFRKWESYDPRSYNLINKRITYEYDLWKNGTVLHY